MWVRFPCPACGGGIKVDDSLAGKRIRCPLCLKAISAAAAPAPVVATAVVATSPKAVPAHAEIDLAPIGGSVVALLDDEKRSPISTVEIRAQAPPPELETPKKKKRKRRRLDDEPEGMDDWHKGLIILGATAIVLLLIIVLTAMIAGPQMAILNTVMLVVFVPFSLVGLVISFFITNAIVGGINFGDIRAAIPKAIALVLIVCAWRVWVPYGFWLVFIPWIIGLMLLFELDWFETNILMVVNWALGWIFGFAVFALVAGMFMNAFQKVQEHAPTFDAPGKMPAGLEHIAPPGAPGTVPGQPPDSNDDDNSDN
jgi:hypothetical protein